ncbi:MAG: UPF0175 family protein [bacterium]
MEAVRLEVDFPKDVFFSFKKSKKEVERELRQACALELLRERKLSFGKAAELAGIPLSDFMDITRENKIPLREYSEEELKEISLNADELAKELQK